MYRTSPISFRAHRNRTLQPTAWARPDAAINKRCPAIDALHGRDEQARRNLAEYQKRIPGHAVSSLEASELSCNAVFWQERNRFYEGLKIAGLPG